MSNDWDQYQSKLEKAEAEVARLRNVVTAGADEAERLYWLIRDRLDAIPGWVHGDDYPCHPILNLSQLLRKSLNKP